jgi:hypothetical protein
VYFPHTTHSLPFCPPAGSVYGYLFGKKWEDMLNIISCYDIIHFRGKEMPAVSFYLNQDVLDSVRLKAKAENIPISRLIREAIEDLKGTLIRG